MGELLGTPFGGTHHVGGRRALQTEGAELPILQ